jgi:hypothetical protein
MKAIDPLRRRLLSRLALGFAAAPLGCLAFRRAAAADLPLLDPSSPAAKKYKYVADASQAHGTAKGNTCATCAMYQGTYRSKRGPCQLFPGRDVMAGGWCTSWDPQM